MSGLVIRQHFSLLFSSPFILNILHENMSTDIMHSCIDTHIVKLNSFVWYVTTCYWLHVMLSNCLSVVAPYLLHVLLSVCCSSLLAGSVCGGAGGSAGVCCVRVLYQPETQWDQHSGLCALVAETRPLVVSVFSWMCLFLHLISNYHYPGQNMFLIIWEYFQSTFIDLRKLGKHFCFNGVAVYNILILFYWNEKTAYRKYYYFN